MTTIDTANRYSSDSDTVCLYFNGELRMIGLFEIIFLSLTVPPQPVITSISNVTVSATTDSIIVLWTFGYNLVSTNYLILSSLLNAKLLALKSIRVHLALRLLAISRELSVPIATFQVPYRFALFCTTRLHSFF